VSRVHIPAPTRRLVTERAQGCCEYCRVHQEDSPFAHPVDHLIALKHGGQTEAGNLALACLDCNRHKGSDLTAIDPADGAIVPLFNPRWQAWAEHFTLDGAKIIGASSTGRATASLLRLNEYPRLMQREALVKARRYPPPR